MEFTKRDEYIFIDYLNVIKCPDIFLLKQIRDKLYNVYRKFLDVDKIQQMTDYEIDIFVLSTPEINFMEAFKICEFDTEKAYQDLYNKYDDMFIQSPDLKISDTIHFLDANKFTKKIYLYTEKYDPRVQIDIEINFQSLKHIEYVFGDLDQVLNAIDRPTTYILNNQWLIPEIEYLKCIEYTSVILAKYMYNLEYRNNEFTSKVMIENILDTNVFKFALFQPITMEQGHIDVLETYAKNIK